MAVFQVMKKRILRKRRPRPVPKRRRTARFCPPEPAIVAGKFQGQKLSELSNEDLTYFLRSDAKSQTTVAIPNIFSAGWRRRDLSQYWFAKYELERRKGPEEREPTSSIELTADDTEGSIALRLLDRGYRAASRKYHPDAGGDNRSMQRLTAARDYARARLKQ
jgi:hypothetical protein